LEALLPLADDAKVRLEVKEWLGLLVAEVLLFRSATEVESQLPSPEEGVLGRLIGVEASSCKADALP